MQLRSCFNFFSKEDFKNSQKGFQQNPKCKTVQFSSLKSGDSLCRASNSEIEFQYRFRISQFLGNKIDHFWPKIWQFLQFCQVPTRAKGLRREIFAFNQGLFFFNTFRDYIYIGKSIFKFPKILGPFTKKVDFGPLAEAIQSLKFDGMLNLNPDDKSQKKIHSYTQKLVFLRNLKIRVGTHLYQGDPKQKIFGMVNPIRGQACRVGRDIPPPEFFWFSTPPLQEGLS